MNWRRFAKGEELKACQSNKTNHKSYNWKDPEEWTQLALRAPFPRLRKNNAYWDTSGKRIN